jgi:hypothetical protein
MTHGPLSPSAFRLFESTFTGGAKFEPTADRDTDIRVRHSSALHLFEAEGGFEPRTLVSVLLSCLGYEN